MANIRLPDFSFVRDRVFLREMLSIAGPVAFQNLFSAGLNLVDVLMVGQLGETAIAALGLANQVYFVLILLLFGLTSGVAIFTAQFWGKRDTAGVRQMLGLGVMASVGAASLFSLAAVFAPRAILGLYTRDTAVIDLGSQYLRLVGPSYMLAALASAYLAVLRSVGQIRLTVVATTLGLGLKTGLSYLLIFGLAGLPRLGVPGAALATGVGWAFECLLLLGLVYHWRTPLAVHPARLFRITFPRPFLRQVARTIAPAALNEIGWALGITTYNAVYARLSTEAVAAVNVSSTVEQLTFVVFLGLGSACAIMVGQRIGAGDKDLAQEYARRFMWLCVLSALVVGAALIPLRGWVAGQYELSPLGADYVRRILLVYCLGAWLRVHNFILFVGALRAGGDTRFAMAMELSSIWLVGVPAAVIGGFVLRWPVYGVYALVLLEEAVKAVVMHWRYRSRRWMHDLVNLPA